ncbi:MAG: steroid-24-oyl-CoA synthetase, partial [Thermoleophilaceae bacterium]|nr:steroid-24-oyl-CoA synthetase [Thermoleophilaceae bacterium]
MGCRTTWPREWRETTVDDDTSTTATSRVRARRRAPPVTDETIALQHLRTAWDELTSPGAMFATEETTVRGIPMRVFTTAPPTMRAVWELSAAYGDNEYVVYEDEHYTFTEVHAQVRALAHQLRDVHGVGSGDRVALAMRNYPEWVVCYWATVSIGAALVGMNAWWTTAEMEYALSDSRPKVLVCDDERLERVVPVLEGLRATEPIHVIAVRTARDLPSDASNWDDVVTVEGAPVTLPDATIDPDDDATIFYTSGTTGFPKGAQLTHRGSVHNILHLRFWAAALALAAAKDGGGDAPPVLPTGTQPVFMATTPLFHVSACNCLLHPCTLAGGKIVLTRKWD